MPADYSHGVEGSTCFSCAPESRRESIKCQQDGRKYKPPSQHLTPGSLSKDIDAERIDRLYLYN